MLVLLGLWDMAAAAAAWAAAYGLRFLGGQLGWSRYAPPTTEEVLPFVLLSLILCPLIYSRMDLYAPKRTMSLLRELAEVVKAVLVIWVLTYLASSLMRQSPLSRMMMLMMLGSWLVLAMLGRAGGRMALRYARARGSNARFAAVIGAGRLGQKLHHTLKSHPWTGIVVSYFIDDTPNRGEINGCPVFGPTDRLEEILGGRAVDIVFVAMSKPSQERIEEVVSRLSKLNVDLYVVPNLLAVQFLRHKVTQLDDLSVISLTHSPHQGWNSMIKRIFDLALGSLALAVLAVPMLLIAAVIKLGGGPVLYRQARASIGGRAFNMLKFRTMHVGAEDKTGPVWTVPGDPRVTRVGRVLRRIGMDELPQLINVLLGDMSLVGPRPERPELIERFKSQIPRYMLRQQVKAGITGWAQVNGLRGQTPLRKRIQCDLFYIRNWSLWFDVWILLLTPFRGLVNANAY
jgi:putative colanic acid biosynthesis UDP-glucose lipid carrier transferase